MRAECVEKLPLDSSLGLCLYPPEMFLPVLISGKILWRQYDRKSRSFQYGISFKSIESDHAAVLEVFLKKQLKKSHPPFSRSWKFIENFIYQKILKKLISKSKIGDTSIKSRADSGVNFDHIYKNVPEGQSVLGKYVDKILLKLPAAEASRQRKENLVKAVRSIITKNHSRGMKTRIVDLGSGPARYLLEAIGDDLAQHVEAICIDSDRECVKLGRNLSRGKNIRYIRGNVFKTMHLHRLSMKLQWIPNLVIASGLIYYFDDHETKQILKSVYTVLDAGGIFLFSNMVFNPNSKLIGKLFTTHEGTPWIPIARSPTIIRRWLTETMFKDDISTLDRWGMYALFMAQKSSMTNPADEESFVSDGKVITMNQEIREFRHNGVTFRGHLYRPYKLHGKGIVLFIHGLGFCAKAYQLDPTIFVKSGYMLYTFNLRGHGGSDGEWTLRNTIEDIKACVRWLSKEYGDNGQIPISILAHSTGSLVSALAAIEEPLIQLGSFVSPVTSIYDSFMHWHESGYNQAVKPYFRSDGIVPPIIESYLNDFKIMLEYKEGKRPIKELNFPYRYGMLRAESFRHLSDAIAFSPDLHDYAYKINYPFLIFVGKQDEVMSLEKIRSFYESVKYSNKQLIETDATNHFLSDSWPLIQRKSIEFFDAQLLVKASPQTSSL